MSNHVHIILVRSHEGGLRRTFADLHRRYTGCINSRARTTGHLWQGRYGSVAMDEAHLLNAVRYGTLNPVLDRVGDFATFLLSRAEAIGQANRRSGMATGFGRPYRPRPGVPEARTEA